MTPTVTHRDDLGPIPTYGTYSRGCRCSGCREEKRRYVADRRAQGVEIDTRKHHGRADGAPRPRRTPYDATPVREHVAALYNLGWPISTIAAAAKVDPGTPARLLAGRSCRRSTGEKILAIPLTRHLRKGRESRTCRCGVEFTARISDGRTFCTVECARLSSAGQPRQHARRYTDEDLYAVMRAAAINGVLTVQRYDYHVATNGGPVHRTVTLRHQGSWARAVYAAGLTPGHEGSPGNGFTPAVWTVDGCVYAVRRALRDGVRTARDYDRWEHTRTDAPSLGTVRAYLGRWSEAVRLARQPLRSSA